MGGCSIHNLGLVGHIEDIVVNKDQQGKKLGLRVIEALDYIAEKIGCYKVCLQLQYMTPVISRVSVGPFACSVLLTLSFADNTRLFRNERGFLRQMWLQACGA